ncbi:hypothetical protein F0562_030570 [Nyssa sinensis]|uniref:Uncharacterized protein n=1 Tax=Nyssa sinensis TaxID=561372 RepID=A0A5J5AYK7_9ASTE|nr:hypothetical protein F0562_030570 [Nyssa sinensis]
MLRRTVKTEVMNSLYHDPTTPRTKSLKDNFSPDKDLADNKMIAVLEKSETMKPARKKINSTPMKVRRSSLMPMRSSAKSKLSGLVENRSVCSKSKSLINEEIFPYVIGLTSSYEVWNALSQAFGSISQNRQLQLHIELQELKRNDMSVSAYLQHAKGIANELQAAGKKFSPAEFNAIIYRNIGSEFHPIITALNLRPEPVSFHELHGQLIAHEILLKSSNALPQANYVACSSSSAPLLPTPSIPPTTQKCTISGPFKQRSPCQICCLRNHTTDKCRKRYTNYSHQSAPP